MNTNLFIPQTFTTDYVPCTVFYVHKIYRQIKEGLCSLVREKVTHSENDLFVFVATFGFIEAGHTL